MTSDRGPLSFAAASHTGYVREINEDRFLARPELGLWLVADGMGGHAGGDIASSLATDSIGLAVNQGTPLVDAIANAHQLVCKAAANGQGLPGMGSTIVALQSQATDYQIAWVGDSRAYLWNGELTQLSKDHSYVQYLIDSGAVSPADAERHPQKHVITQSLGMPSGKPLQVDRCSCRWSQGHKVLLCSDGLTNELSDREIAEILVRSQDDQAVVDKLLEAALEKGGRDNITVVLISSNGDSSLMQRLHKLWRRITGGVGRPK